jgi:hypothetical protein
LVRGVAFSWQGTLGIRVCIFTQGNDVGGLGASSSSFSDVDSKETGIDVKPRISLRMLFVVATLLIVFFGYSQLRRKKILEVCDSLRKDGYVFDTPNGLRNVLWQRKPTVGKLTRLNGEQFMWARVDRMHNYGAEMGWVLEGNRKTIGRLKRLGVVEVE